MKKSFLITLAAVSSVALIGCSSSSDDKGPGQETNDNVSLIVAPLSKTVDSQYLVSTVDAEKGDGTEATIGKNIKVTCDKTDLAAEQYVVDNDMLAVKAAAVESATECSVSPIGDLKGDAVKLVIDDANYPANTPATVTFKDAANGFNIKKDGTKKPSFTFESGSKAGTVKVEEAKITVTPGEALDKANIETTVSIKDSENGETTGATATYTQGTGVLEFDLSGVSDAVVNATVNLTYSDSGSKEITPIPLNIEVTPEPTFYIDEDKTETHAANTTWAKFAVAVKNVDSKTIKSIACTKSSGDCNAFFKASGTDAFMIKVDQIATALNGATIEATLSDDTTKLPLDTKKITALQKSKLVPLYTISEINCTNGTAVEPQPNFTQDIVISGADANKCFEITTANKDLAAYSDGNATADATKAYQAAQTAIHTIAVAGTNSKITQGNLTLDGKTDCKGLTGTDKFSCVTKLTGSNENQTNTDKLTLKTQGGTANTTAVELIGKLKGKTN